MAKTIPARQAFEQEELLGADIELKKPGVPIGAYCDGNVFKYSFRISFLLNNF